MPVLTKKQGKRELNKRSASKNGNPKKRGGYQLKATLTRKRKRSLAQLLSKQNPNGLFPAKAKRAAENLRRAGLIK